METAVSILLRMVLVVKAVVLHCTKNGAVHELLVAARRGSEVGHQLKKRMRMTS